jgi:hypothetical protein
VLKEKDVAIKIREQELLVVEERLAGRQRVHIHLICLFILGGFDLVVQCSVKNFWQPIQGPDTKIDWDFLIGTLLTGF